MENTEKRTAQQERCDQVREILRAVGWEPCRIALWLARPDREGKRRIDAVNEGGEPFERLLAEAREIARGQ